MNRIFIIFPVDQWLIMTRPRRGERSTPKIPVCGVGVSYLLAGWRSFFCVSHISQPEFFTSPVKPKKALFPAVEILLAKLTKDTTGGGTVHNKNVFLNTRVSHYLAYTTLYRIRDYAARTIHYITHTLALCNLNL